MKIPFFEMKAKLGRERKAFHEALDRVLNSGVLVLGPEVAAFEAEIAHSISVPANHMVTCNSGTDAIVLGLRAMGVGYGDEVILPSHTAVPTVTAVRMLGATPRFADIDPETWVLDAADALSLVNPRTKAVVAVHLYGNGVNLGAFDSVRHLVLEDVAQAQGGRFGATSFGTWGRAGAFSFYPTKNLGALGDGGAMCFRDPGDAELARRLRFYGQKTRYLAELDHGMNSRLDELQAAFLRVRLPAVQIELERKSQIMRVYEAALKGLPLKMQKITPGCEPAWHLCVVAFESEKSRERASKALEEAGIGALIHYPTPNHLQPAFASFSKRPLPVTENLCQRILSLPLHPELGEQVPEMVADCLKKVLSG